MNPNGSWTLFVADLVSGDAATLNSWSLTITGEVPEPGEAVLVILGAIAGLLAVFRLHPGIPIKAHLKNQNRSDGNP